jgi:hypothetical protein
MTKSVPPNSRPQAKGKLVDDEGNLLTDSDEEKSGGEKGGGGGFLGGILGDIGGSLPPALVGPRDKKPRSRSRLVDDEGNPVTDSDEEKPPDAGGAGGGGARPVSKSLEPAQQKKIVEAYRALPPGWRCDRSARARETGRGTSRRPRSLRTRLPNVPRPISVLFVNRIAPSALAARLPTASRSYRDNRVPTTVS